MIRKRWVAVLTTIGLLLLPASVSAINYGGVGAKPANPQPSNPRSQSIFLYQLKPGQQATDGVKVMNNTPQAQTVSLYAVDSVVSNDGSFACAQNADPKHGVGSWIQLSQDQISLEPNSDQVVPFTIAVPNDTSLSVGEHDGCIAVQAASQTAKDSSQAGVLLSFRTATRVVVTIPGKIVKKLTIDQVDLQVASGDKLHIAPHITNAGNVSLDASLSTKLLSVFGVSAEAVKNGTNPVLPHDTASWNFNLSRPFWGGFYRAQVIASYNYNPATGLGMGGRQDQRSVTRNSGWVFVVPKPAALIIELIILGLIIAGAYWLIQRKRQQDHIGTHWTEYKVKARDTLPALAEKHDIEWRKLARANKLKPPYHLQKGQILKLPPKE